MNFFKKLKHILQHYTLSENLSLDARILNMILSVGLGAGFFITTSRIIMRQPPTIILIMLGITISVALLMALVNIYKIYKFGILVFILVLCDVLFPIAFFLLGGMEGGMTAYFVLTMTAIFLLVRGRNFFILLSTHILWVLCCYYLSFKFPHWVIPLTIPRAFEQIQAFLLTGFFIGLVIKFQGALYIREKKKAEETMEKMIEADERTRIMLNTTPLGCTVWDMNFNIIDCNLEALRLFGFESKQDFLEKFSILSPEYQDDGMRSTDKQHAVLTRALNSEHCIEKWVYQKLDGSPIPAEITINRVVRKSGDYILLYIRDLREYHKILTELEQQGSLLYTVNNAASILLKSNPKKFEKDLWECMGLLANSVNADMMYIWKNKISNGEIRSAFICEWSKTSNPEHNRTVNLEVSGEDVPGWFDKLVHGKCFQGLVKDLPDKQKETMIKQGIISMLIIPVFLQDLFWGFVGFDDCSKEREFTTNQVAILHSGSLLITSAMQRNEMIENLIHARENALSSTRAKTEFLANMSHEMRTPMNAIIGMTNIAKGAPDVEKKNYCLSKIEDASNHLLGVINDILDMSKIEANKFELSLTEFNFEKTLSKAVNVINFRVEEKKQHFTVHLGEGIPQTLIGDDQRLTQVITNLLSNAIKFTPEHGTISLKSRLVGEETNELGEQFCTIQIDVTDSGIGINEDQKERLFHSFEQADSNTSRKFGGTGLGLAISKSIVEMMGGMIRVESESGKGATFSFTAKMQKGRDKPVVQSAANWGNIRVLVVDDDPSLLEYFAELARRFELACDTVPGGMEAIAMIEKSGTYDIYFIDWKMPGMDGNALTRYIKERFKNTVVVMISATEWTDIEDEAKKAGVDHFLAKPLFPSGIANLINEILGTGSIPAEEKSAEIQVYPDKCILLAEDIEINREIVISLLEPVQLQLVCAENGKQAVAQYCAAPEKYDMIFMDVQMPEMDGYEATRRIRAFEDNLRQKALELELAQSKTGTVTQTPRVSVKRIPIIAMTANVFKEDVEKCLAAGMDSHVGKPLDMEEIMKQLKEYLS
jgi:PAS domain S-box-containing protein